MALQFQLDKAPAVAPAQIIFSGVQGRRTSIVPNAAPGYSANAAEVSTELFSCLPQRLYRIQHDIGADNLRCNCPRGGSRWWRALIAAATSASSLRRPGQQLRDRHEWVNQHRGRCERHGDWLQRAVSPLSMVARSPRRAERCWAVTSTSRALRSARKAMSWWRHRGPSDVWRIRQSRIAAVALVQCQSKRPQRRLAAFPAHGQGPGAQRGPEECRLHGQRQYSVAIATADGHADGGDSVLQNQPLHYVRLRAVDLCYAFCFRRYLYDCGQPSNEWQDHRTEFGPMFTF